MVELNRIGFSLVSPKILPGAKRNDPFDGAALEGREQMKEGRLAVKGFAVFLSVAACHPRGSNGVVTCRIED